MQLSPKKKILIEKIKYLNETKETTKIQLVTNISKILFEEYNFFTKQNYLMFNIWS